jgi:hypothetical protein
MSFLSVNAFSNEQLDYITETSLSGFHEETIRNHWANIIGFEKLQPDETVRLVVMPSPNSIMAKTSNIATGGWADKNQIRSADDLINRMIEIQGVENPGDIGFALSAGIYNYIPEKSPNYGSLKYIQNMIIDIDAHKNAVTKDRFNMTTIKPSYLKYSAMVTLNYVNGLLTENGLPHIHPVYTALTGGGFQFGIRFDRPLDKESGKRVFETFGSVLGFSYLNKKDDEKFQVEQEIANKVLKENSVVIENTSVFGGTNQINPEILALPGNNKVADNEFQNIKKKKGLTINIKSFGDEWFSPFMELDNSFKDVTHAQRIPGTINQKYSAFAYVDEFISNKENEEVIQEIIDETLMDISINNTDRTNLSRHFRDTLTKFNNDILKDNPNCLFTKQPTDKILSLSPMIQFANSQDRNLLGDYISLTEVEKQILATLAAKDKVLEVLGDLGIEVVKDSTSYIACRSPFRTDAKPSFAVYINAARVSIKDFTEDKTYNFITLWMAVNDCNKAQAIEQIALRYGIRIDKTDKKEFQKLQTTESVTDLIKEVNTVDYVYYRLANSSKNCIIKSIKTGISKSFDGYKMLADHVLKFQLKIKNPDKDFREAFEEAFLQYVIIDAFEDFLPGGERTFEDDYIQYVNIWTASDSYKKCWEESESLQEMKLDEAINLIKEICPTIYVFLLQITQKGNLNYFVNWLNAIAKFQYLPIVPIFPSIEGAGKNLFANEILAPYVNDKFLAVANGQALQSNFNSFMGHSNLIIADEGDFTGSREFDQLKLLTGNNTVRVEKKGVDAQIVARRFNICMFTNGSEPVRHSATDRRCVYFKLEHTLEATLTKLGFNSIDEFIEKIKNEVHKFWGIIIKTKLHKPWINHNLKNGQYMYQIFMMHPFGKLVLKIIENKWDEISLQLNEKQKELQDEKINMALLQNIESAFFNGEPLSLITINKYLDAMSWKSSTSIQDFINKNNLQKHGIKIIIDSDSIKIQLDAQKLQELVFQENNLVELIPEFAVPKIKTLDELRIEMEEKRTKNHSHSKILNASNTINVHTETFNGPGSVGFSTNNPLKDLPTLPMASNLPQGI